RHEDRGALGRPSGEGLDGHVVVCGFGRVGSAIGEALETFGVPYVAIETDPDIVKSLRARKVPAVFGDAAQRVILAAGQADRAAMESVVPEANVPPVGDALRATSGMPRLRVVTLRSGDLIGRSLGEARVRERFGVNVIAVERATGEIVDDPSADTVLREGDRIRLFGLPRQIEALLSGSAELLECSSCPT